MVACCGCGHARFGREHACCERTAVDQFGSGDKYVGVATLLATLPGLPMFGHGQVEGFGEKYGMEFRRATGGIPGPSDGTTPSQTMPPPSMNSPRAS